MLFSILMSYLAAVYYLHAFFIGINKLTNFVLYIYVHDSMKNNPL
jgi:hypothetical protein